MKGYGADLALVHEIGFTSLARDAAELLVRRLRAAGIREGLVVDVGCGGGTFAAALVDAGYRVLGLDVSPSMIRLARRREPRATFRVGSFRGAKLPACVAVAAVGEGLSYLFDPRVDAAAVDAFLARAHAALAPNGLLMFDIVETMPRPEARHAFVEADDALWAVLLRVRDENGTGIVRREITTFRKVGATYRRTVEVHRQRRYSRAKILRSLRRLGFAARVVRGYGKARFRKGHVGFVARKT
ncbi:MAG: class I SAM-dependent methyltransferase [bacterium]